MSGTRWSKWTFDCWSFPLQAEDARSQISAQEQQLTDTQAAWEVRQAQLWEQLEELTDKQEALKKDRTSLASDVEPVELNRYEGLRRSNGRPGRRQGDAWPMPGLPDVLAFTTIAARPERTAGGALQ